MKKCLAVLCLLALLLTACALAEEETPFIHVEFVVERFLGQLPSYDHYADDPESTSASRLMFFAEAELQDFRYLRVEASLDEEGELRVAEKECLLEKPVFGPDEPLLIETELTEGLPTRAFTFTAPDGSPCGLFLTENGEYGTPVLVPCTVETSAPYLTAEFVIERFVNQLTAYEYYADEPVSEYASRVIIFAEAELTDVRILDVNVDFDAEGRLMMLENATLFTAPALGPDMPLVIEMELPEILPRRVISYLGPDGGRHFCYPALSGRDGMPVLVPCLVETEDRPQ